MEKCTRSYPKQFPRSEYPEFADRLRVAMELRGCTTVDLAARIYTSQATISMYRCGKRAPSINVLRLLAIELQVTTDFLLGLTDYIYV